MGRCLGAFTVSHPLAEDGHEHFCSNLEQVCIPSNKFVEGGIRIIEDGSEGRSDTGDDSDVPTTAPDSDSNDENDESFLMSAEPVTFQLALGNHYPWWDDGLEEMDENEQQQDQDHYTVNFAQGHQGLLQDEVEHIRQLRTDDDTPWLAVTYGLGLTDLGRRDIEFDPWHLESLPELIQQTWQEFAVYADLLIFNVHPQPIDVIGARAVALLVVVDTPESLNEDLRNVLVIEQAVSDVGARRHPYAAKLSAETTDRDILAQLNLQHHCPPLALRPCHVRLGTVHMDKGQLYEYDHGTLCRTWIGNVFSQVLEAEEHIIAVDAFFLQVHSLMELRGQGINIVCHVHGITPANRPLGHREIIIDSDWLYDLEWIDRMRLLWPFGDENVGLVFAQSATQDMHESENIIFHFIAKFGTNEGQPILVNQQMWAIDDVQQDPQSANEFWAISVPSGEIGSNIVGALQDFPFWFHYARSQNVYPHLAVNGQKIVEVRQSWRPGDVLRARYIVWKRHHVLTMLIGVAQQEQEASIEHTSFLQLSRQVKTNDVIEDSFTEICQAIMNQKVEVEQVDEAVSLLPMQQQETREERDVSSDDVVADMELTLSHMLNGPWIGLNTDFAVIPQLHPIAQAACRCTPVSKVATNVFHIFTDGSCKNGDAAWSFIVLCECNVESQRHFVRIGYAAGRVDSEIGPTEQTAQDAEATALIAAANFMLTKRDLPHLAIHFHFDATAVGKGSCGTHRVIQQSPEVSKRQMDARVMVSLLQRKASKVQGLHVHAHEGQPWNEFADSVAGLVRRGWSPPIEAVLTCGPLLRHSLAHWAWLSIAPDEELPSLRVILQNESPDAFQGTIDRTLDEKTAHQSVQEHRNVLRVATVNVGTLEQSQILPGTSVSHKTHEIIQQFLQEDIHVVAVQEGRARCSRTVHHGPFTCFIGAASAGVGGVELWINGEEISRIFDVPFDPQQDACVWYATHRLMAVRAHIGDKTIEFLTCYAPQRARPAHEIHEWWDELETVMRQMKGDSTCIILGDFNCKIGSINTDAIGSAGADLEDFAGSRLRRCCEQFDLAIPSTWDTLHQGEHWTFCGSRGSKSRLDYIAVSNEQMNAVVASYVHDGIDVLNGDRDHRVLVLELGLVTSFQHDHMRIRKPLYNRKKARSNKLTGHSSMLHSFPLCSWRQDVNDHWSNLRDYVQDKAASEFPKGKRQQRQLYFSPAAWDMVCRRKDLRQQHRELQRCNNLEAMKLVFETWRQAKISPQEAQNWELSAHLRCMQEAVILEQRCKVDVDFRKQKREDWKRWVSSQLDSQVTSLQHATASQIYKILKPKKMIDKKKGRHHKPLAGLRDARGQWRSSRGDVAAAWEEQFAEIELAEEISFQDLMKRSVPSSTTIHPSELHNIPTFYDLENCLMALSDQKATGVDGLGAELWHTGLTENAMRIFPLLMKSAVRQQGMPEMSGGWLLPLWKGKGHPSQMEGYRAILLEPTLSRALSKAWRSKLICGLERVAAPLQCGGRKGVGISPLHLMLRIWQSNAASQKSSLGLIYVDIRSAFYRVAKPLLANFNGTTESLVNIFQELKLPSSALQQFLENVHGADLISRATGSGVISGQVSSNLAQTWFLVPNSSTIRAPRMGTRPGDPCADILFGFALRQVLQVVMERAESAGLQLCFETEDGRSTSFVAWVDDLALSVMACASKVVSNTAQLLSIIIDVMTEHGLSLSVGKAKTAVMFEFRGKNATKCRQDFEKCHADTLDVLSEHHGVMKIPVVGFYKHLGGIIVPYGSKIPEIKTRGEAMRQKLAPLKAVLSNPRIDIDKRRLLVRSMGMSVIKLHSATWFDLTQAEAEAWHAVVHATYAMLERRNEQGEVPHKETYELARQMEGPMPIEALYLERLRLLVHILQVNDHYIITAILQNYKQAGCASWLYGVLKSLRWAQAQIGRNAFPDELLELTERSTWDIFHEVAKEIKSNVKKVERAHQVRLKTYCGLKDHKAFMEEICSEMGWTKQQHMDEAVEEPSCVQCGDCGKYFKNGAALATHEQRVHQKRIALRRFVVDGVCRACGIFFHTRARLLTHLHVGKGKCWLFHLRRFAPLTSEQAGVLDDHDRTAGQALHQMHVLHDHAKKSWRMASQEEMKSPLQQQDFDGDIYAEPTPDELQAWASFGLLPPGRGGRDITQRTSTKWEVANVCRDVSRMEEKIKKEAAMWEPNFDWIPRSLSEGQLFFLVLFSGHRRFGDISSWMQWDNRVVPLAVDLAVSKEHGNVLDHNKWLRLIQARRVVGAHGGPPCETYSMARWLDIPGQMCPQPLRDQSMPWGRCHISLKELLQCHVGSILMWETLKLLLMVYAFGGSVSLEHPKGEWDSNEKWCVWMSGFIRWMLKGPSFDSVTFLQGPLGQCAPKPTTMLLARMGNFAAKIYGRYQKGWKPTEFLGGKDHNGWKTARAKVYPVLLSQSIAECHLEHYDTIHQQGFERIPDGLDNAIAALSQIHDPYHIDLFQQMAADFHHHIGRAV
ncbi:unnamed protein product [Cladocopium goreaui]|uniref:Craniofacial development protein 2 n=1 Tax=Cladocopium goreaui TaxID=2562237 RepID=A0A9P1DFF0_9DINO|nr:unnamed protein product [Cladocopium goreaui]